MARLVYITILMMGLSACGSANSSPVVGSPRLISPANLQIVTGQTLYVPAYSEIFYGSSEETIELSVTLAIHNTDLDHPMIVQSVRYYNTDGVLVRDYVEEPVEVSPLATIGFVVPTNDLSGGWGANFIVEWGAEEPVYEPIVEAVMVSTRGTHGISMVSPGRILSQTTAGGETDEAGDRR